MGIFAQNTGLSATVITSLELSITDRREIPQAWLTVHQPIFYDSSATLSFSDYAWTGFSEALIEFDTL
jgi:hypothetical protein